MGASLDVPKMGKAPSFFAGMLVTLTQSNVNGDQPCGTLYSYNNEQMR